MENTMLKRSKMVRWDVAFLGVTGFTGCLYPKEQRETKVSLMLSTGCHEVKHACFTMFTLVLFLVYLCVWFAVFHWVFNLAIWLTCRWVLLIQLYPCLLINNCTCDVHISVRLFVNFVSVGSSYNRISLFWWILNGIKFSLFWTGKTKAQKKIGIFIRLKTKQWCSCILEGRPSYN